MKNQNTQIDPRLIGQPKKPKEDPQEPKTAVKTEQLVYTIPQLAKALPGIGRGQIEALIESGDIRSIPAGGLNKRYITIPRVTFEEDLRRLVEKYA